VAVEPLELRADEGERLGRRDEGGVVLHRHLLHLPPHPLRVDPQQLRLLVEALDGEGEELGDVGLVGRARERERGGRGAVHVGGGGVAVARVEEVHGG